MKNRPITLVCCLALLVIFSCHRGSQSPAGPTFAELRASFPVLKGAYGFTVDSAAHLPGDSSRLDRSLLADYIPDSAMAMMLAGSGNVRVQFYPQARLNLGGLQAFLLRSHFSSVDKAYLLLFNRQDSFVSIRPIASFDAQDPTEQQWYSLDKRHLLTLTYSTFSPSGHRYSKEFVYSIGQGGTYQLILTNSSEPASLQEIFNPIDSLPLRHRFSGDYYQGNLGLVSIRDGKTARSFHFYIHLSQDQGNCTGDLEGEGTFVSPGLGVYKDATGPCALQFRFTSWNVTLKETGGCGAYRGISCYFEGSYRKGKLLHPRKS